MSMPNIHEKELMLCKFGDQQGVIYYELLKPNETVTALQNKRPRYFTRHEDNTDDTWIASPEDEDFFQRGIRMLPERWAKVVAKESNFE